jgi:membrane-associated progesterone receptor component
MSPPWLTGTNPPPTRNLEDSNDGSDDNPARPATTPLRNFTAAQLLEFDGKDGSSIYLSLNGQVFDCSDGRDYYGPDGPYGKFAGRECGVAMAKMSFDESYLDQECNTSTLTTNEMKALEGWVDKFTHSRQYPVVGRLVPGSRLVPLKDRILTEQDLMQNDGSSSTASVVPEGYATQPIYVGVGRKVFDVSFGGGAFYGPGGGYSRFAGRDVSRALAKMSFAPEDLENTTTDDLDEKQRQTLHDWVVTFEEKKKYPVVGRLQK